jgi:hypothetical protein
MGIRKPNSIKDIKGWVLSIRNGAKLRNKGRRQMSGDFIQRGYDGLGPQKINNLLIGVWGVFVPQRRVLFI